MLHKRIIHLIFLVNFNLTLREFLELNRSYRLLRLTTLEYVQFKKISEIIETKTLEKLVKNYQN